MPRVLITGCSSGIGRALAEELISRNFEVIATARSVETLADLPATLRLALDVTSDASVEAAVAQAGRIDVLVNNAGLGLYAPVEAVPLDSVRRLFDVNVYGVLRMIQAVAPQMRGRQDGLIVQMSSVVGRTAKPVVGHYSATKHALEALSEAMRVELAAFGVRVSLVELGPVDSEFGDNVLSADAGDYEVLMETFNRLSANPPPRTTLADVAIAIANVIAEGGRKLRYEGTPGAFERIAGRLAQDDGAWEDAELRRLGIERPGAPDPG